MTVALFLAVSGHFCAVSLRFIRIFLLFTRVKRVTSLRVAGGGGGQRANGSAETGGQDETTTTSFEVIRAGCISVGCQINLLATLGTRVPIITSSKFPSTLALFPSLFPFPSLSPIRFRLVEPFERCEGNCVPASSSPISAFCLCLDTRVAAIRQRSSQQMDR